MLVAALTSFCFAFLAIKLFKPIAVDVGLVDKPNARKHHSGQIPLIGGISIYTGVLIASSLFVEQSQLLNLYFISSALLVFIGTMDDIYDLNVAPRMIFQGIVATIMVFGANVYIHDFGNILSLGTADIGNYGMIFTMLACVAAINAFNMIDGIDGLAGSMSIVSIASVAILTLLNSNSADILLPLILVVAIIPYLFYNVSTRNPRGKKIFMGDAGSMFMGLTVIWLLALGTQNTSQGDAVFRPVTALWIIAVPLMDMFAIMLRRLRKGVSPFKADNGHLHHICMRLGLSSRQALWAISTFATVLSAVGIAGDYLQIPEVFMLTAFVCVFLAYAFAIQHAWKFIRVLK